MKVTIEIGRIYHPLDFKPSDLERCYMFQTNQGGWYEIMWGERNATREEMLNLNREALINTPNYVLDELGF